MEQELLNQSTLTNTYLFWILIVVILVLVIMVGVLVAGAVAFTKLNARLAELQASAEAKWTELEPKIQQAQVQFEEIRAQVQTWMPILQADVAESKEAIAKGRALMGKVEEFWDDFSPEFYTLLDEGKVLFGRARVLMNDIQTTVVPTIRTVSGVANAFREGLGVFRQVRHNHPVVRR